MNTILIWITTINGLGVTASAQPAWGTRFELREGERIPLPAGQTMELVDDHHGDGATVRIGWQKLQVQHLRVVYVLDKTDRLLFSLVCLDFNLAGDRAAFMLAPPTRSGICDDAYYVRYFEERLHPSLSYAPAHLKQPLWIQPSQDDMEMPEATAGSVDLISDPVPAREALAPPPAPPPKPIADDRPPTPSEQAALHDLDIFEQELQAGYRCTPEKHAQLVQLRVPEPNRGRHWIVCGLYEFKLAVFAAKDRANWRQMGEDSFRKAYEAGMRAPYEICPAAWGVFSKICWKPVEGQT